MRKLGQVGVLMGVATVLVFLVLVGPAGAVSEAIICHQTGSQSNPFEVIVTDDSGAISGHQGHPGDIIDLSPTQAEIDQAKSFGGGPDEAKEPFCESLLNGGNPGGNPGGGTTTQASTGFSALPYAAAAVLLLGLGGGMVLATRRRTI